MSCASCSKSPQGDKLLRCSRCKQTVYCNVDCQTADWKKHKKACQSPQLPPDPARNTLPGGCEELLARIHECLDQCHGIMDEYMMMLKANKGASKADPAIASKREEAERLLSALPFTPELSFQPADPEPLQQILLSIVRLMFLESLASFTDKEKDWLAYMLDNMPPYGKRIPKFRGKEIVTRPGECSARTYEGLFRCAPYLFIQVDGKEEVEGKKWREIAETFVMLWRED